MIDLTSIFGFRAASKRPGGGARGDASSGPLTPISNVIAPARAPPGSSDSYLTTLVKRATTAVPSSLAMMAEPKPIEPAPTSGAIIPYHAEDAALALKAVGVAHAAKKSGRGRGRNWRASPGELPKDERFSAAFQNPLLPDAATNARAHLVQEHAGHAHVGLIFKRTYERQAPHERVWEFRCENNRTTQCPYAARLVYNYMDKSARCEAVGLHAHKTSELTNGLTAEQKAYVLPRYKGGAKPQHILVMLQQKSLTPLPTLKQIQNFCYNSSSRTRYPYTHATFEDWARWCDQRRDLPPSESEDQPFVLEANIVPSKKEALIVLTTRRCLSTFQPGRRRNIDATYKLNTSGFAVIMYGADDAMRQCKWGCVAITTNERAKDYMRVFQAIEEGLDMIGQERPTSQCIDFM